MSVRRGFVSRFIAALGTLVLCVTVAAACSASTSTGRLTGRRKVRGGTARLAAAAAPNFIFPFTTAADSSIWNAQYFQWLMYRPLYWFGGAGTLEMNSSLSLAEPPTYMNDGRSAVISLKDYRWSNGERVTADDVVFWMNMMHADKKYWYAYAPGTFPDNVKRITVNSATTLTFDFDGSYNAHWMTYNELSQITPMPKAWDLVRESASPGSGGCFGKAYGTADEACDAVFEFLSKEAGVDPKHTGAHGKSIATYATNPLWQIVDGPWRLTKFDTTRNVTMAPNHQYSGPVKPTLDEFVEVPFTSDVSEYNALRSGALDVGNVPNQDVPPTTHPLGSVAVGALPGFTIDPLYAWGFGNVAYTFNSTGDGGVAGRIFSQLYIRQAFQSLVDQTLYIRQIARGWGVPLTGPIPTVPSNLFVSALGRSNPYPYDVAHAKQLLVGHGWHVIPNGASTCSDPGTGPTQCGAGIPKGARLAFTLEYYAGDTYSSQLFAAEKSSWAQAGINIDLRPESSATLNQSYGPCASGAPCTKELTDNGWLYSPDIYPTGETIFASNASSNVGSYSDPTNDANIKATYLTAASLDRYQAYVARELPVIWEPHTVSSFTAVRSSLRGVTPQNPLLALTPENWYFTK